MSHDLHFCHRQGDSWRPKTLEGFCRGIPFFKQTAAGDQGQWWYENPDTGVYFSLDFGSAREKRPTLREGFRDAGFSFNMNYVRPRFFAEEAMPVVRDLCAALNAFVVDPQGHEGGGYGIPKAARPDELIETWVQGNRSAVHAYCTKFKVRPLVCPPQRAKAWWLYQRRRAALQEHLGDDVEAPQLLLLHDIEKRTVLTGIGWTDAVPIVLPPCDIVFIQRQETSRPGAQAQTVRGWITAAALREAIGATLTRFYWDSREMEALDPSYAGEVRTIFDALPLQYSMDRYQGIAPDSFLDEES